MPKLKSFKTYSGITPCGGVVGPSSISPQNTTDISTAASLTNLTTMHWNPTSSLTTAYTATDDTIRAYFVGTDKLIYQFTGLGASTEAFAQVRRTETQNSTSGVSTTGWTQNTIHDLTWLMSDSTSAQLGAVGWGSNVGFLREIQGQLAESTMTNGVWSAKFLSLQVNSRVRRGLSTLFSRFTSVS